MTYYGPVSGPHGSGTWLSTGVVLGGSLMFCLMSFSQNVRGIVRRSAGRVSTTIIYLSYCNKINRSKTQQPTVNENE